MEGKKKTIDSRLEQKIGFDRIRQIISDKCSTSYAAERTATETFSNKPADIRKRLLLTDEMRLIMMFEDRIHRLHRFSEAVGKEFSGN